MIGHPQSRAIFLDRDGVLNRAIVRDGRPYPPESPSQLELLPGVEAACRQLRKANFLLIMVTNQPDISRGTTPASEVDSINRTLKDRLQIDAIQMCPHDDSDECECRKPKPGMLLDAAREYHIDLKSSFVVGDRWRDIEAGRRAGCRTVWIDAGYKERPPQESDCRSLTLSEAVAWILGFSEHRTGDLHE